MRISFRELRYAVRCPNVLKARVEIMVMIVFKIWKNIVILSFVVALAGCATLSPSEVVENIYLTDGAPGDVATVNFIRLDGKYGAGVAIPIYLNSTLAMRLRIKSYATLPLKPGQYTIRVADRVSRSLSGRRGEIFFGALIFSPGETYYLFFYPEKYGQEWTQVRIRFKETDEFEAKKVMGSFKFIPPPKFK